MRLRVSGREQAVWENERTISEKRAKGRCGKQLRGRKSEDQQEQFSVTCKTLGLRSKLAGFEDGTSPNGQYEGYVPRRHQKTWMRLAKDVYWQTWATKHDIGELTEGVLLSKPF